MLKPVKEVIKNLVTEEAMKELINGLEDKLVKKINPVPHGGGGGGGRRFCSPSDCLLYNFH